MGIIAEKRIEHANELRRMCPDDQYKNLVRYGHIRADVSGSGYDGEYRTTVYDYYTSKWFVHMKNGILINIQEV